MTRGKKLLILTLALIIAGLGAWLAVKYLTPKPKVIPMEEGDVIFTLGGTKLLTWEQDGQTISFDLSTDPWTCLSDESFVISQTNVKDILDALSPMRARKDVPLPENLADYGLETPRCTITAGDTVIQIGNQTSLQTQYYVYMGGDRVYLVDQNHVSPFLRPMENLKAQ